MVKGHYRTPPMRSLIDSYKEMKEYKVCGACLGHSYLVAYIKGRGVTVYPCPQCNKDESKEMIKIDNIQQP